MNGSYRKTSFYLLLKLLRPTDRCTSIRQSPIGVLLTIAPTAAESGWTPLAVAASSLLTHITLSAFGNQGMVNRCLTRRDDELNTELLSILYLYTKGDEKD
ncbi:hypothetical protein TSMEX_003260 [Taenia solium]|eukprot:TsM_000299000 transcript=TsM_000299000 gene=TsM_000299000